MSGEGDVATTSQERPQADVHLLLATPVFEVTNTFPGGSFVLKTNCGKIVNDPGGLIITDDVGEVTCRECKL
jgi:hypothetical protein